MSAAERPFRWAAPRESTAIANWKRAIAVSGLGALVLTMSAVVYFWRPITEFYDTFLNDPVDDRPFDRTTWHAMHGSWDADNPRGRMVKALRTQLLDSRPTQPQVLDLLGEPEFERRDDLLSYNLGMWSGFRIDYDSLDVHFGSDGRVQDAFVVQH